MSFKTAFVFYLKTISYRVEMITKCLIHFENIFCYIHEYMRIRTFETVNILCGINIIRIILIQ